MQKLVTKIAPLVAMTTCAIWCCWLQIRESTPLLAATEASLPRIERKLLYPEICPPCQRDPFQQNKPEPPPSALAEAVAAIPEKPPFNPDTALAAVRLDATILGASPLAVINGKLLEPGATIELEKLPELRCRLLRVLSREIVVEIEQQTFHVRYASEARAAAEAAPMEATPAKATPAAEPDVAAPGDLAADLPPGIPPPDDLDRAVAEALAQQAKLPSNAELARAKKPAEQTTDNADEACEDGQDFPLTEKLNELLNHDE